MKQFVKGGFIALAVVYGLFTVSWNLQHDNKTPTKSPDSAKKIQPVRQNPTLKKHFKTLGIDNNKVSVIYGDSSLLTGEDASYRNNTILINPRLTKQVELQMVAHEYMHYFWQTKLSSQQKQSLSADIESAFNSDPFIANQLDKEAYRNCFQSCRQEEKYTYACTALYDYSLTPKLARHCSQVIPGRHALAW